MNKKKVKKPVKKAKKIIVKPIQAIKIPVKRQYRRSKPLLPHSRFKTTKRGTRLLVLYTLLKRLTPIERKEVVIFLLK